jgi:acyl-CoA thioester hydrolase
MNASTDDSEPRAVLRDVVRPEWIDRNGHFNAGAIAVVFDEAIGAWLDRCGMVPDFRREHQVATFTAESHLVYLRELHAGAPILVTAQLLDFDAKRLHTFLRLRQADEGFLVATNEVLSLHVDMTTRRVAPFGPSIVERFSELRTLQRQLARPPQAGRTIGIATAPPARE